MADVPGGDDSGGDELPPALEDGTLIGEKVWLAVEASKADGLLDSIRAEGLSAWLGPAALPVPTQDKGIRPISLSADALSETKGSVRVDELLSSGEPLSEDDRDYIKRVRNAELDAIKERTAHAAKWREIAEVGIKVLVEVERDLDPGDGRDELVSAVGSAEQGARELEEVARNPRGDKAERAAKKAGRKFEACVEGARAAIEDLEGEIAGTTKLLDKLDRISDRFTGAFKTLAKDARPPEPETTEPTEATGPGPEGGETADLPLCAEGPLPRPLAAGPCLNSDGQVLDASEATGPGPGPGGGETADLPLCSESPPPCRTPDGSVVEP